MATYPAPVASGFQPNPMMQTMEYRPPMQSMMPGFQVPTWTPGTNVNPLNATHQQEQIDRLPDRAAIGTDPRMTDFILGRGGFEGVMPNAEALFRAGGQKYYPGNAIAGFNANEIEGQRQLKSYASAGLPGLVDLSQEGARQLIGGGLSTGLRGRSSMTLDQMMQGGGAGSGMLREAGSGSLSPYHQDVLQGGYNDAFRQYGNTVNDISQNYETGMHSADDAALLSGNFGGSRGEIARGIVGREATRSQGMAQQALSENMSQAYSGVMNDQFSQARDAQIRAGTSLNDSQLNAANTFANLYGTDISGRVSGVEAMTDVAKLGMMPGEIIGGVGEKQSQLTQSQIDAAMKKFQFEQAQPWGNLNNYANVIGAMSQYGNLGYQDTPSSANPWASAIGGGLSGAGAGALAGAKIGSGYPGWGTLIGGGIGAIGGYLGSRR